MIGQIVSHYRILEKLGGGGMGVVYKAEDTRLGRAVALKFLPPRSSQDPQRRSSASSARRAPPRRSITPTSARSTTSASTTGQHFIVMELLEGADAQAPHRRAPARHSTRSSSSRIQIADALDAAHAQGHRPPRHQAGEHLRHEPRPGQDARLRPRQARAARRCGRPAPTRRCATADAQRGAPDEPGRRVGTVAYMSPEQARGEELDARTDLFSFGVVLYEMATGRQAFAGTTTAALIFDAILNRPPVPPLRLNPELPPELERIIHKALEKDRGCATRPRPTSRPTCGASSATATRGGRRRSAVWRRPPPRAARPSQPPG